MSNLLLDASGQNWPLGIFLAILILLVMITIHEFGHYLMGKLLKFKIDEFSIGFGPALFKHKSKKTGEIFAVRLIPLGGYCAFEGEDGLDEEPEKEQKAEAPSESDPFLEEFRTPPEEAEGAPSPAAEKEPEALSEGASSDMPPANDANGSFTKKKPWQRILVLIAGALMNYLLALVLILILIGGFGQSLVEVRGVAADESGTYPAEFSLREGDILLGAEGQNFYLSTDVAQAVNNRKAGDLVVFRVARRTDTGYEETEQTVMLRGDVSLANSAQFTGVWRALGIGVETREDGQYYMLSTTYYRFGFFETVGRSFMYSFKIAGSIFRVIGELFTGRLGLEAFGGPVTTITMTSQIAASGVQNFLEIAAYIGVNLAVFNLLPIPALDGSKVVFTAIEWVRGKPISRKVEAVIHAVGLVLLFGFAILVDVLQFL